MGDNREFYNGQQRFLLYRFHEKDPVYFSKNFKMTIDILDGQDHATMITHLLHTGIWKNRQSSQRNCRVTKRWL